MITHSHRVAVATLSCLLLANVAVTPAAGADEATLTLPAALATARADSPLLRAADRRSEAARRAADAVRSARLGRLDGQFGYTRYQDDVIVRPMSRDLVLQGFDEFPFDRDQFVGGVGFSLPVYTGGRLSTDIEAAVAGSRSAASAEEATEDEVLAAVRIVYARGQVAAGQIAAVDGRIRSLESRADDLERQVEVGRAAPVELRRVQADVAWSRSTRLDLQAQYEALVGDLLAIMGQEPLTETTIILEPLDDALPRLRDDRESLRERALASPGIDSVVAAGEAAQHRADRARAESLPSLTLAGNWISHLAPGLGDAFATWEMGLQVSIPVFDGGARRAREAEARARAEELSARADEARAEALAALRGGLARWQAATSRLEAARSRLAAERAVEEVERLRWETGAGTLQDLLDAEADRLAAESELVAARGGVRIAAAELNRIAGAEVVR